MHIPDNYLSPATCAVMGAAMIPIWIHSVKKIRESVPKDKIPLLGIGAAFSFLAMMLNIPLPGGTTGHAVGGTLIALMLGPEAACISVTIALLIQALLFGDGGILAFGANCFNMAFLLPYTGYYTYLFVKKITRNGYFAAATGGYVGLNIAAFFTALEFGIQPLLFTDSLGNALYCPYPLSVSIPAMMIGHLTLFGLAEAVFTAGVYAYMRKASPDVLHNTSKASFKPLYILIGTLILITPVGLFASGTAWGEWGIEEISSLVSGGAALGYTPSGMQTGFSFNSLFPDYTMGGIPDYVAYILSAAAGAAILIIIFKLVSTFRKERLPE